MEEVPSNSQLTTEENIPSSNSFFKLPESPFKLAMLLLGAIIIFGLIASGIFFAATGSDNQDMPEPESDEETSVFEPVAPYSFVYGYWENEASQINMASLEDGRIYEIASLPYNSKKVTIMSPSTLVFINKTNIRDHGAEVASYNMLEKQISPIITADEGFGIDDYVLSPNKRYMVVWEVSVRDGQTLSQGLSRVYAVDLLNPSQKNLIFNEDINITRFVNYPVAITNDGEVYTDAFLPNSGAGRANGMMYSDFTGASVQVLTQMESGTYGTDPKLSPDGKYLVFTGYDGSMGAGVSSVGQAGGFRRAILSPNTVEMLDVTTKARIRLPNLPAESLYSRVFWDTPSGKIHYSMVSSEESSLSGEYLYDYTTSSTMKIDDAESIIGDYVVLASLDANKFLVAKYEASEAALGNLGNTYTPSINTAGVFDKKNGSLELLTFNSSLIQYIGLYPQGDIDVNNLEVIGFINASQQQNQLQLNTFSLKPTIAPVRTSIQSDPPPEDSSTPTQSRNVTCGELATEQCNELLGKVSTYSYCAGTANSLSPDCICYKEQSQAGSSSGTCYMSPLYLYGEEGQKVSVSINTPIYRSNAGYKNGQYSGVLTGDGGINIGGSYFENIDFDYNSALRRLPLLDYGKTVATSKVGLALHEYGKNLGLTQKEVEDTVKKISSESINSPYIFVSFFNDEQSKAILPITFSPTPDVYRNIVFYLKPTDKPIVAKTPKFETFERQGFTAVEVSYILDR